MNIILHVLNQIRYTVLNVTDYTTNQPACSSARRRCDMAFCTMGMQFNHHFFDPRQ